MAKEKVTVIDLRSKIKVVVTEKNPYATTGTELEVHPIAAAKGVKQGFYEQVSDKKK